MANAEKPNTEYDDPAKRPSLNDQNSGPAERAVMGTMGPGGMIRLALGILLFIIVGGLVFSMLNG